MEGEKPEGEEVDGAEQVQESNMEGGQEFGEMEDSAADDDIFKNNHDLIGI
tara:strand:+ start:79 stop:231 length:153 start_codon:yes stop_codon:yes gene_type:complete